jgi:hypothetical protein
MTLHLRQICLVARELAPVVDELRKVFSIEPCHVDPGVGKFGLENTLLAVGSNFIEVVAPVRDDTAAGRFLKRRGGDAGYMVICQVPSRDEQEQVRQRAADNDVRVAYDSDRGDWHIMQLHPADMGASFLEVEWDSEADPTGNWHPAGGKDWKGTVCRDVISDITAAELQSDDPGTLARRWAAVLGLPLQQHGDVLAISLANAQLRFVQARDGRGEGLGGIDVRATDRTRLLDQAEQAGVRVSDDLIVICGTRFRLVD